MDPVRPALAERDLRDTVVVGSLEVDRAPVTNARYAAFVDDTGHRAPAYWPGGECPRSLAEHPVVGVDYFDAVAFAAWAGGALPTELEWVEATGLDQHKTYVWGDRFESVRCNTVRSAIKGTTPVDAYPEGAAPSGCLDMCGNVWEMTCSSLPSDHESVIVKGGSWYDFPVHAQIDARFRARVHKRLNTVGFRLVYGRPVRFPEFLDADLVAACICHRLAVLDQRRPEVDDSDEFQQIVDELQRTTRLRLPDFTPEPEYAVEQALAMLEAAEEEVPEAVEAPAQAPVRRSLRERWKAASAEARGADLWSRIVPTYRALRSIKGERTMGQRIRSARMKLRKTPGRPLKRYRVKAAWETLKASLSERTLLQRAMAGCAELRRPHGGPSLWQASAAVVREMELRETWDGLKDRVHRIVARKPRVLFLILGGAVLSVIGILSAASSDLSEAHRAARLEASLEDEPVAAARRWPPVAETAPDTAKPAAKRMGADEALRDIMRGRSDLREAGERYLIWHGDASYMRVKTALDGAREPGAQASLRYVLAAIEEARGPRGRSPEIVFDAPRKGLVLFCERVDGGVATTVEKVRRTAKAEKMPMTVVLTGKASERTVKNHGDELGAVQVYLDVSGRLIERMRIPTLPAVAGLHADGRLGFLLVGAVTRARLAQNVARLTR